MPECDCGTEIVAKNAAGHYRDQCVECIAEASAAQTDAPNRPPDQWLAETDEPEGWDGES
jgi:hypothetical protein